MKDFSLTSQVIKGNQVGTPFGIATANLEPPANCALKHGVYLVECQVGSQAKILNGLWHWGPRATFGGELSSEVHLLDFDQDIYAQTLSLTTKKFLRPTRTFANGDQLFTQIETDILQARKYFTRQQIIKQWPTVIQAQRLNWINTLNQQLANDEFFQIAPTVLLYAAFNHTELDFASDLMEKNPQKTFAFPLVTDSQMTFHVTQDFTELKPSKFGIPEPSSQNPIIDSFTTEDLVIVPGLGGDQDGNRLGRGGGFYDQFLASFPGQSRLILPQFAEVIVPTETHDQKVDQVLFL